MHVQVSVGPDAPLCMSAMQGIALILASIRTTKFKVSTSAVGATRRDRADTFRRKFKKTRRAIDQSPCARVSQWGDEHL
jgi:hypothetical protein